MDAIVVIGASAGGLLPVRQIVSALSVPCSASIFVVIHIGRHQSALPSVLSGSLPVSFARGGATIAAGHVTIAPPDHHMLLQPGIVELRQTPKVHYTRPAADPLFISAAETYGDRVIGIVLSGGNADGAAGLRAIRAHGGTTFVQLPEEAGVSDMPRSAIAAEYPSAVLPVAQTARRVSALCAHH